MIKKIDHVMNLIDTLTRRTSMPSRQNSIDLLEAIKTQIDERVNQLRGEIAEIEQQKLVTDGGEIEVRTKSPLPPPVPPTVGVEDVETSDNAGEAGAPSQGNPEDPPPV